MTEKLLGKITHAEFGQYPDRPFLFGLQLCFEFGGSGVCCGGRYTVNISPECKWEQQEKLYALENITTHLNEILYSARVNHVSGLLNKPVEVTLEHGTFKDFRILTEVL